MNALRKIGLKLQKVRRLLKQTNGCTVAYSGGVDSALLLAIARQELGPRCLAVLMDIPMLPRRELKAALRWLQDQQVAYRVVKVNALTNKALQGNHPRRCYFCKKYLFQKIKKIAQAGGLPQVAEGSHLGDRQDYRPGRKALRELNILSPLEMAGMEKSEIRILARKVFHLPMANQPSRACLATRFPYGARLTKARLLRIEILEDFLWDQGLRIFRTRDHDPLLRLELGALEQKRFVQPNLRKKFILLAKKTGFRYVTLDLEGFRSGSMNETLGIKPF